MFIGINMRISETEYDVNWNGFNQRSIILRLLCLVLNCTYLYQNIYIDEGELSPVDLDKQQMVLGRH